MYSILIGLLKKHLNPFLTFRKIFKLYDYFLWAIFLLTVYANIKKLLNLCIWKSQIMKNSISHSWYLKKKKRKSLHTSLVSRSWEDTEQLDILATWCTFSHTPYGHPCLYLPCKIIESSFMLLHILCCNSLRNISDV